MSLGTRAEFASIFFIENAVCTDITPGPPHTTESVCETDGQSNGPGNVSKCRPTWVNKVKCKKNRAGLNEAGGEYRC